MDFTLYDEDFGMRDDLVANLHFSKKDIIKQVGGDPTQRQYHMQWFNLYGCNASKDNKYSKMQNEDHDLSTTYKGRVLVEYSCIDMDTPEFKI
jgi:hypothetical protein